MHQWGDETFDWQQLDESIEKVDSFMRFWGRIGVASKEKFGCARIYVSFWDGTLHGLLYPSLDWGNTRNRFPRWLQYLDSHCFTRLFSRMKLMHLVHWYQSKIYGMAYSRGLKAGPKVKIELVINADFPELIKQRKSIIAMYKFRCVIEQLLRPVESDYDNDI